MYLNSLMGLFLILVLFLIVLGLFCLVFGAAVLAIVGLGAAGNLGQ